MHADASQGQSGIHEDEIMGMSLDAALAKEETAEQDVVSQLRHRAASLERDLLQRSLDGLAPNSKVHCPLAPSAPCMLLFSQDRLIVHGIPRWLPA